MADYKLVARVQLPSTEETAQERRFELKDTKARLNINELNGPFDSIKEKANIESPLFRGNPKLTEIPEADNDVIDVAFLNNKLTDYSTLKNIVDGSSEGSARSSNAIDSDSSKIGLSSFALGYNTSATGDYSISTGINSQSSGQASFSSGSNNQSSGQCSVTFGNNTSATHRSQFVFGENNNPDPSDESSSSRGTYVEIVGNGSSSRFSNARTLDWDGNEVLSGKLTLGNKGDVSNPLDVVTFQNIDELKSSPNGIAGLDNTGHIDSSLFPDSIKQVHEYPSLSDFPETGSSENIYLVADTHLAYIYSGSEYALLGSDLKLGTTSDTAFRGDYGSVSYDHASDPEKLSTPLELGLYKISSTSQGHLSSAEAVTGSDIVDVIGDSFDDKYLKLTGGTVTGKLEISSQVAPHLLISGNWPSVKLVHDVLGADESIDIKMTGADGVGPTAIPILSLRRNDQVIGQDEVGSIRLRGLANPIYLSDATNKSYVDSLPRVTSVEASSDPLTFSIADNDGDSSNVKLLGVVDVAVGENPGTLDITVSDESSSGYSVKTLDVAGAGLVTYEEAYEILSLNDPVSPMY